METKNKVRLYCNISYLQELIVEKVLDTICENIEGFGQDKEFDQVKLVPSTLQTSVTLLIKI